ncbi:hypothetical protein QJU23_01645 [Pasteurella atlantica]|uniref:Uncharacterized protein n=2 Tax=Pasteurellaceae TaxID=712 RepID=A0ACC6HJT9_9PAST|nr:hypothetical protein [Pasteurella atlantica]MDP8051127.1 hypothetical protein [Pasteurella atlantica]MDP8104423.1 hypothetical protein [Pasteurella atlantica]MDP8147783.1 hypothetical protein [Pasteurella atlantica]
MLFIFKLVLKLFRFISCAAIALLIFILGMAALNYKTIVANSTVYDELTLAGIELLIAIVCAVACEIAIQYLDKKSNVIDESNYD